MKVGIFSDTIRGSSPEEVAERTRDRANRLGNLDLASQDVAVEVLRELEKQLWMVRVQFGG